MIPHIPSRFPAVFCYTLPMARDLSPYKILVVDDEADVRAFICTVLEDNGATVLQASDGDAGLEAARREEPVCIISAHPDLRRLIYQRTVPPPDGYLDKPIDEKGLLLNVRKTLSLKRRRHTR